MDIHEHGISAYPEYVISALAAPTGMPRDTVGYIPASVSNGEREAVAVQVATRLNRVVPFSSARCRWDGLTGRPTGRATEFSGGNSI